MKFDASKIIRGCVIITPEVFYDGRGEYVETYSKRIYDECFGVEFVEDDISTSRHNVLRGLHGDDKTWKLVQCLHGDIVLAVVDYRGETYKHELFYLNEKNRTQILIPPCCANGHYVLSKDAIFSYKQSEYYSGDATQITLRYDDPKIGINWGIGNFNPIISERDAQ